MTPQGTCMEEDQRAPLIDRNAIMRADETLVQRIYKEVQTDAQTDRQIRCIVSLSHDVTLA